MLHIYILFFFLLIFLKDVYVEIFQCRFFREKKNEVIEDAINLAI